MLRTRVITAVILGALLLIALFRLPASAAIIAFGVVFTLGAWEWAAFGGLHSAPARAAYSCAIAILLFLGWHATREPPHLEMLLSVAVAWWAVAFVWMSAAPARHQAVVTLLCGSLVLVPAFVALARMLSVGRGFARGPQIVLWMVLLVIASDIGAYFAGRAFGRRKLAPRISPGKTWEGALGGLAAVALVAGAGAVYFALPPLVLMLFGLAVGAFSVIGDLTESMFKRAAGLKDSGALLPGHGGLLDRIDSVTAAAPLYALGLFGSGVIA